MVDIEKILRESMAFTSYKIRLFFEIEPLLAYNSNFDFDDTIFLEQQLQKIHQEKFSIINSILFFFTKNEKGEIVDVLVWNKYQNNYFFCYVYINYEPKETNEEKKKFISSFVEKLLFQSNNSKSKVKQIK